MALNGEVFISKLPIAINKKIIYKQKIFVIYLVTKIKY